MLYNYLVSIKIKNIIRNSTHETPSLKRLYAEANSTVGDPNHEIVGDLNLNGGSGRNQGTWRSLTGEEVGLTEDHQGTRHLTGHGIGHNDGKNTVTYHIFKHANQALLFLYNLIPDSQDEDFEDPNLRDVLFYENEPWIDKDNCIWKVTDGRKENRLYTIDHTDEQILAKV